MENALHISGCTISTHQCKCFEILSEEELNLIDRHSVWITYKKGEMLCKQGGLASNILYMEKGLAKIFMEDGKNSLVLKIIPDGNFIGLTSIAEDIHKYQYSSRAYIDSTVRQIDIKVFRTILDRNPRFAREVIEIFATNSTQIYSRFFCLVHKQSFGKLADILLCLTDRIFKSYAFDLPLSRKELAELTGMSQETVVRMLRKFHDENLIKIEGKKLHIIDYQRLQHISETG